MPRLLTLVATLGLILTAASIAGVASPQLFAGENNNYVPRRDDRLPDLIAMAPDGVHFDDQCYREFPETDTRTLVCFDSQIANIGLGPLELTWQEKLDGTLGKVYQKILNKGDRRRVTVNGGFFYHNEPGHNHLHFGDFARYRLFVRNKDGTRGTKVAESDKVSFNLADTFQVRPQLDPSGAYAVDKSGPDGDRIQGISVGWADLYYWGLSGQEMDITGLPAGLYVLRLVADPRNRIAEVRNDNNFRNTVVQITASGKMRLLSNAP